MSLECPNDGFEESAARKQARIDQGKDIIVGVNKYQLEKEDDIDVLEVPSSVRDEQIQRIQALKANRDNKATEAALKAVTQAAETDGNLLEAALGAV